MQFLESFATQGESAITYRIKEITQQDSSHDMNTTENDYESLDKYTGEYEEIHFPPNQITGSFQQKRPRRIPAGNYEFSQCPAYMPITRKVVNESSASGNRK